MILKRGRLKMFDEKTVPIANFIQNGKEQPTQLQNGGMVISPPQNFDTQLNKPDTKNNYNMINMFWLYNEKQVKRIDFLENEAGFCTIGYNCNFGNIRIDLFELVPDCIIGHCVFLNKLERKFNCTIYPSSIFKFLCAKHIKMTCMEQLVTFTGEPWQYERPKCILEKKSESVILTIQLHTDEIMCYEFLDWQRQTLLHSFKFAISDGMKLMGAK